jgi:hypothetical protein
MLLSKTEGAFKGTTGKAERLGPRATQLGREAGEADLHSQLFQGKDLADMRTRKGVVPAKKFGEGTEDWKKRIRPAGR